MFTIVGCLRYPKGDYCTGPRSIPLDLAIEGCRRDHVPKERIAVSQFGVFGIYYHMFDTVCWV